jgi:hypothetical protein
MARGLAGLMLLCAPVTLAQRGQPAIEAGARSELRKLEAALTRAADAAARPSVFALQAGACRGSRIEGVGAVFVLPPRALRSSGLLVWRRQLDRAGRVGVAPEGELDREIRVIELQAEALQREAARTQQEVERAVAEVRSEIHRRQPEQPLPATSSTPLPPEPPAAPTAPEAPLPPSPPWTLWFDAGLAEEDAAPPPATIVARVRGALVDVLASHGGTLRALRAEETVVAAVDFVPGFPFAGAGIERTLVVRVRKKDLEDREAGRIPLEELKTRIDVAEY